MEILIDFWLGVIITIITMLFVTYLMCHNGNMYCNSSYNRGKDSLDIELDKPEYKVEKVERCYCKNNMAEESLVESLDVKDVDLEKEYDNEFFKDPVFGKLVNRNAGISIAKHFFELGLNVQKGE